MGNCFGNPPAIKPADTSRNGSPGNTGTTSGSSISKFNSSDRSLESGGSSSSHETSPPSGKIVTPNLKIFTLTELKSATRNFRPDTVLGEGGFGRVFKGWIDEKTFAPSKVGVGIPVAVKKSSPDSSQGLEEWQSEVKFLGKFSHPNLVKLLGYCWEEKQYLLVYEHMRKGSLEKHLFRDGAEPLTWEIRLKIAIGAAQGLAFLHSSEKSVIYRDFKTSNILLDGAYNAKLSDFGLAKLGPINGNSHVTTRVMGTYGYAAPEYVATGHLYVKSDVYGFGVVLLEMLTGKKALDPNRPTNEHNLVEWAKPYLKEKRRLKRIMDLRLEEQYPINAAMQAAQLILYCLEADPKNRPSMEEVLIALQNISKIKDNPKEKKTNAKNRSHKPQQEHHHRHHHQHSNLQRSPLHSRHGGTANSARPHRSPARYV